VVVKNPGDVKKREQLIIVALVSAVIVLAALNSERFFFRLDLSANRMYSLSDVSKKIARGLAEPLSITYFKSEKLASRYSFPRQIEDILGEYVTYSGGRISLSVIDPASGKTLQQPESLGVVPQQMQVMEKQELNVATVYSGIVIKYLDRYQTLPFVTDPGTLEYEVSSKIRSLVTQKQTSIAILLGDDRKTMDQDYRFLQQDLQSQFAFQTVQKGADISPGTSALLVIGARDLGEYELYPIDQYIMGGGKVVFAVDSVDVDLAQNLQAAKIANTVPLDMLAVYGVRVLQEMVLDKMNLRIQFRVTQNQFMVANYPHWVMVTAENVSKSNPITTRFAGLDLYWPCALESIERQGVKAETLATTSSDAWIMKDNFQTNPVLSNTPMIQEAGQRGRYTLALALSGRFKSYFQGRAAPTKTGEPPRTAPVKETSPDTRIIVVGDADFASDLIQYTQANNPYNLTFISNCLGWLVMEEDLLGIKTKSQVDLRLNKIEDPAVKSRATFWSQILNIAVIPFIVILFGVLRLVIRRRRAARPAGREAT
jgi:ABC-2 type transport system permease protein